MNRPGVGLIRGPGRDWSIPMIRLFCLMVAVGTAEKDAAEATDWMKPSTWQENFWGPAATRARLRDHFHRFRPTR